MKKILPIIIAIVLVVALAVSAIIYFNGDNSADEESLAGLYSTDYEYVVSELDEMQTATYAYDDAAPSLHEAFADYFKVGSCIQIKDIRDTESIRFKAYLKQFNIFTLEYESKADTIHPSEDTYDFAKLDEFIEFGEKYGVSLRAHTLIWHASSPDWFFYESGTSGEKATPEQLLARIDEYVTTVVSRYKGEFASWDVVNEVLNTDGTLRESEWLNVVGDYDGDGDNYDFIEQAFISASKADPDARLIINEYDLEWSSTKVEGMYNLIKSMLQDGIKVDGVGLQMHTDFTADADSVRKNLERLAELREYNPDFVIEITEMDMSCYKWDDKSLNKNLTESFVETYDNAYKELFELFMEFSEKGLIDSVVFWGVEDGHSWRNNDGRTDYPFTIARDYVLKSAYWDLISLTLDEQEVAAAPQE